MDADDLAEFESNSYYDREFEAKEDDESLKEEEPRHPNDLGGALPPEQDLSLVPFVNEHHHVTNPSGHESLMQLNTGKRKLTGEGETSDLRKRQQLTNMVSGSSLTRPYSQMPQPPYQYPTHNQTTNRLAPQPPYQYPTHNQTTNRLAPQPPYQYPTHNQTTNRQQDSSSQRGPNAAAPVQQRTQSQWRNATSSTTRRIIQDSAHQHLVHHPKREPNDSGILYPPSPSPSPSPPTLKVNIDSHVIKKPPSPSFSSSAAKPRHPVIIYTHTPKIIRTNPKDFMALVQKLTGMSHSDEDPGGNTTVDPGGKSINRSVSQQARRRTQDSADQRRPWLNPIYNPSVSQNRMVNPSPYAADPTMYNQQHNFNIPTTNHQQNQIQYPQQSLSGQMPAIPQDGTIVGRNHSNQPPRMQQGLPPRRPDMNQQTLMGINPNVSYLRFVHGYFSSGQAGKIDQQHSVPPMNIQEPSPDTTLLPEMNQQMQPHGFNPGESSYQGEQMQPQLPPQQTQETEPHGVNLESHLTKEDKDVGED